MKYLALLLLLPALAFGQYEEKSYTLGTDSVGLNYIGSHVFRHHASGPGVGWLFDQGAAGIAQMGIANIDSLILAVGAAGYITVGVSYDTPTSELWLNNSVAVNADGSVNFPAVMTGRDAFTTTATSDDVTVTGASVNDNYFVQAMGTAALVLADAMIVEVTATGFTVHRGVAGTSGLQYMWWRVR